jgi:hypothetical protein
VNRLADLEIVAPAELHAREQILKAVEHLPEAQARSVIQKSIELMNLEKQRDVTSQRLDELKSLQSWLQTLSEPKLERNEHSRVHKLKDAAGAGLVYMISGRHELEPTEKSETLQWLQHTFVVKHDWAAAFDGAEDFAQGDIRLPFPICSFEFRISGRSVIAYAFENDGTAVDNNGETPPVGFSVLIESGQAWYSWDNLNHDESGRDLGAFVWQQIRAICIALDAEVATHTVVRAPAKLNEKRAKAGRSPLPDFMVIDLSRRHRVANPSVGSGDGTKKRLHFRRGHWRHYETHKTWIKWCLVGDPSLGFVGKHYAL